MAKTKTLLLFPCLDPERIPPTIEDVEEYCQQRGNKVDAEMFCAFYGSKGWMVGKNKMKNWQLSVITWERRDTRKPTIFDGIAAFASREESA